MQFKVGDKVQFLDYGSHETGDLNPPNIFDGEVTEITSPKRLKPKDYWKSTTEEQLEMVTNVTVKFDSSGESKVLDEEKLSIQDSKLEREYRKTCYSVTAQINEKLLLAHKYLYEAETLSEKFGVPFHSSISPLSQNYKPLSLELEFSDYRELSKSITEVDSDYDGWEHSQVCW